MELLIMGPSVRMTRFVPILAASLVGLVLLGCGHATQSVPASSTSTPPTAAAGAQEDLDRLLASLERTHPNPWHGIDRTTFVAALTRLKAQLPTLTAAQAMVGAMRLVALISRNGRDGHMLAIPVEGREGKILPIRVYGFAEGWYVTDALAPHQDLIGGRITQLAGHPIADVLSAVEPLVPRDGPATVPAFLPIYLLRVDVLRGLGLVGDGPVRITVVGPRGEQGVSLDPVPFADFISWAGDRGSIELPIRARTLYLSNESDVFWTRYLSDSRTLYARYVQVHGPPPDVVAQFREQAAKLDVDRVVVDLRQNGGGDNNTYGPLLRALQSEPINQPGRLFVITDRLTFSAAANFCTELEQTTKATFVGEAMGGGLNFWDDVTWVTLPHFAIPLRVGISTRYWQKSTPDDPRLTLEPDIAVPVRASDYFADKDPALAAALAAAHETASSTAD
jgi:hypothetical protein